MDHRPEDVRVDPPPVLVADVAQVAGGDPVEEERVNRSREQALVHVVELPGPGGQGVTPVLWGVHRGEGVVQRLPHPLPLITRVGEREPGELVLREDPNVLREHAEDQPGHQLVHVVAPVLGGPVRVLPDQVVVELGELSGHLDVDRVLLRGPVALLAGRGQEEPEPVPQLTERAVKRVPGPRVFSGDLDPVGGDQDGGFVFQGSLVGA